MADSIIANDVAELRIETASLEPDEVVQEDDDEQSNGTHDRSVFAELGIGTASTSCLDPDFAELGIGTASTSSLDSDAASGDRALERSSQELSLDRMKANTNALDADSGNNGSIAYIFDEAVHINDDEKSSGTNGYYGNLRASEEYDNEEEIVFMSTARSKCSSSMSSWFLCPMHSGDDHSEKEEGKNPLDLGERDDDVEVSFKAGIIGKRQQVHEISSPDTDGLGKYATQAFFESLLLRDRISELKGCLLIGIKGLFLEDRLSPQKICLFLDFKICWGGDRISQFKPRVNMEDRQKRVFFIGLIIFICVVIVITLATALGPGNEKDQSTIISNKFLEAFLRNLLEPVVTTDALRSGQDTVSHEYQAFRWMVNHDSWTRSRIIDLASQSTSPIGTDVSAWILERFAVVLLYFSTRGPYWKPTATSESTVPPYLSMSNTSFLAFPDSSHCDWGGVADIFCDEGGYLTRLRIVASNLRGTIPRELGLLTKLEVLALPLNFLEGTIPPELFGTSEMTTSQNNFGMKYLRVLDLDQNFLTGSIPSSIANLAKLESLELSRNRLYGTVPSNLGTPPLLPGSFPSSSQLHTLLLHSNVCLSGTIPPALLMPSQNPLQILRVDQTGIRGNWTETACSASFSSTRHVPIRATCVNSVDEIVPEFMGLFGESTVEPVHQAIIEDPRLRGPFILCPCCTCCGIFGEEADEENESRVQCDDAEYTQEAHQFHDKIVDPFESCPLL